jgi:transposase
VGPHRLAHQDLQNRNIEPFAYLKATLTALANGHPQSSLDDLLPWNFTPSK